MTGLFSSRIEKYVSGLEVGDNAIYLSELRRVVLGEVPLTNAMKQLLELDAGLRAEYDEMKSNGVIDVQAVDIAKSEMIVTRVLKVDE